MPLQAFVHHFVAGSEYKLELQAGNAQPETESLIFLPWDLETWQMTLKNNRTPLLHHFKLWASFRSHLWIQTGVTVRKRPNWGKICFDLCGCDLWFLILIFKSFAWTSLLSRVIPPKNFITIRWEDHYEKGVTDGLSNGLTDRTVLRTALSQLKKRRERERLSLSAFLRTEDIGVHISRLIITYTLE